MVEASKVIRIFKCHDIFDVKHIIKMLVKQDKVDEVIQQLLFYYNKKIIKRRQFLYKINTISEYFSLVN